MTELDDQIHAKNRADAAAIAAAGGPTPTPPNVGPAVSPYQAFARTLGSYDPRKNVYVRTATTGADVDGNFPEIDADRLEQRTRFCYGLQAFPPPRTGDAGVIAKQQRAFDVALYNYDKGISAQLQVGVHEGGGGPQDGGIPQHIDFQFFAYLVMTGGLAVREHHIAMLPPHRCPDCEVLHSAAASSEATAFPEQAKAARQTITLFNFLAQRREQVADTTGQQGPSGDVAE